jgi:hypothetical protein
MFRQEDGGHPAPDAYHRRNVPLIGQGGKRMTVI